MPRLSQSATLTLLLSPAGLLIITAARLLIVSDYNSTTALAILSSNGYANTLLGAVIPMAPIFMPYIALLLLLFDRLLLSLIAFSLTLLISPTAIGASSALSMIGADWHLIAGVGVFWLTVMAIIAVPLAFLVIVAIIGVQIRALVRTIAILACMALSPTIIKLYPLPINNSFYADLVRQPWLPAVKFTLNPHRSITGYTLATDGGWFEILQFDSRSIEFYPETEVVNQQICLIERPVGVKPLVALVRQQSTILPLCSLVQASSPTVSAPTSPVGSPPAVPRSGIMPIEYLLPRTPRSPSGG